jgi:hypothetical protein
VCAVVKYTHYSLCFSSPCSLKLCQTQNSSCLSLFINESCSDESLTYVVQEVNKTSKQRMQSTSLRKLTNREIVVSGICIYNCNNAATPFINMHQLTHCF